MHQDNETPLQHVSVLLEETIDSLDLHDGDIVVDGTFGGGGHSAKILASGKALSLICVDLDEEAFGRFAERLRGESQATFVHANFKDADRILREGGEEKATKVLLDLGTSTFQLLADTRGFSFQSDAPLSMTFSSAGAHTGFTASDIVNRWEESSIADIIYYYGEDRRARKIARAIVEARAAKSIDTGRELAMVIERAVPRFGRTHPATKTFQALRIAVNDEIKVIEEALGNWWKRLADGGRIAVITFHSIEDRTVKRWMLSQEHKRVITKKPITPTDSELSSNPRSRSAKLRVIQKLS